MNEGAQSGTSRGLPTRSANGHPEPEPVLYVADAALDHRRSPADARLGRLSRAAYARGRASRRFDTWRHEAGVRAPSLAGELRTLAGCLGHVLRRRCPAGLTMVAHSGGRLREALRDELPLKVPRKNRPTRARRASLFADPQLPHKAPPPNATYPSDDPCSTDDFLSGESGTVGGLDGLRRASQDLGADALDTLSGRRWRLDRAAHHRPPTRKVLVLGIERPEHSELARGIRTELARSRHNVEVCFAAPGDRGKFENLNLLLESHKTEDNDWLLVADDDIVLPRGFLDRFLFLAERFRLDLVQPAHRLASHAAWRVTRRRFGDVAHETRFVEIGPLTAFAHSTLSTLLPFPDLRMGWGLDLHWAALARDRGWRCGVIDAVPISHRAAPAAGAYSREQALTEARAFLSSRPYLSASEAQQTLVTHRRW